MQPISDRIMETSIPDPKFFIISTRGRSGSMWLSNMLSRHPGIVAFHGANIPEYYPGEGVRVSPAQYARDLIQLRNLSGGNRVFGCIHSYHYANDVAPVCDALGGHFAYIVRHPIKRMFSIFWGEVRANHPNIARSEKQLFEKLAAIATDAEPVLRQLHPEDFMHLSPVDTYKSIKLFSGLWFRRNILFWRKNPTEIWRRRLPADTANLVEAFLTAVHSTLFFDMCALGAAGADRAIKFEEMTVSQSYFENVVVRKILPSASDLSAYLETVFQVGPVNSNTSDTQTSDWRDIFSQLPAPFQEFFLRMVDEMSVVEQGNPYTAFDYEMP